MIGIITKALLGVLILGIIEFGALFLWIVILEIIHKKDDTKSEI